MAQRDTQDKATAGRDAALRASQVMAFLVGVGVCLALSLGFAIGALGRAERSSIVTGGERVNPNEAPVASLMRLPQIGAARARAIVAHRDRAERQPAFRTADDLQRIKGLGPVIAEGVRPWLQFDDRPADGNESPKSR